RKKASMTWQSASGKSAQSKNATKNVTDSCWKIWKRDRYSRKSKKRSGNAVSADTFMWEPPLRKYALSAATASPTLKYITKTSKWNLTTVREGQNPRGKPRGLWSSLRSGQR